MSQDQTYITAEGLAKLKQELARLKQARKDIAARIQDAKELGDLSENAEYAEAKNVQAFNEGRIIEIENILKNAELIDNSKTDGYIKIGSQVTVFEEDKKKQQTFTIVGSSEANPANGSISNESPLGQAFIGHKVGENIEVQVPKGIVRYKIVAVK